MDFKESRALFLLLQNFHREDLNNYYEKFAQIIYCCLGSLQLFTLGPVLNHKKIKSEQ